MCIEIGNFLSISGLPDCQKTVLPVFKIFILTHFVTFLAPSFHRFVSSFCLLFPSIFQNLITTAGDDDTKAVKARERLRLLGRDNKSVILRTNVTLRSAAKVGSRCIRVQATLLGGFAELAPLHATAARCILSSAHREPRLFLTPLAAIKMLRWRKYREAAGGQLIKTDPSYMTVMAEKTKNKFD